MSACRIHSPLATSVTPPQYSGCRSPSITVRSRSLIFTDSCLVTQCFVVPNKCSGLMKTKQNSIPFSVRFGDASRARREDDVLRLGYHAMNLHRRSVGDETGCVASQPAGHQIRVAG